MYIVYWNLYAARLGLPRLCIPGLVLTFCINHLVLTFCINLTRFGAYFLYILFIGIHTRCLNVTRGYGNHSPLTTTGPKEEVTFCICIVYRNYCFLELFTFCITLSRFCFFPRFVSPPFHWLSLYHGVSLIPSP
jgi:hypothetical protein